MSKQNKKAKKIDVMIEKTVATETVVTVSDPKTTLTSRYKMIPVDQQTYLRLLALCEAHGFGQRGQGAMVRRLVNLEFEKIPSAHIVPHSKGFGS